jgi:hypothetical protein
MAWALSAAALAWRFAPLGLRALTGRPNSTRRERRRLRSFESVRELLTGRSRNPIIVLVVIELFVSRQRPLQAIVLDFKFRRGGFPSAFSQ